MKSYFVASILICILQGVFGSSGFSPQVSWDGDPRYDMSWKEFHDKVYARDGDMLDPSETLRLLKILEEKYKIRHDEESVLKYKRVMELLNIASLNSNKCERPNETFKNIGYELSCNQAFVNVVAFLNHYKDEQFNICRQTLSEKLQYDVELLPKSYGDNLQELKESILNSISNDQSMRRKAFRALDQSLAVKGVANYLERKLDPFVTRVLEAHNGVNVYNKEFDKLIREPCDRIATGDKQIRVQEIRILSNNEEILDRLDLFSRNWLENYNLCYGLTLDGDRYINRVRDQSLSILLKNTRPVQKKQDGDRTCLSCIGSRGK